MVPRVLAAAVYRPLAEQLVETISPRAGERIVELSSGGDELARRLRERAAVEVTAIDAADGAPTLPLPFPDRAYDVGVSLLAVQVGTETIAALEEVARVSKRARMVTWEDGATHEQAFAAALRDVGAAGSGATPVLGTLPAGWNRAVLRDVARFDSVTQLLTALLEHGDRRVSDQQMGRLRDRLAHHLSAHTAADGTLRVPVWATLLSSG